MALKGDSCFSISEFPGEFTPKRKQANIRRENSNACIWLETPFLKMGVMEGGCGPPAFACFPRRFLKRIRFRYHFAPVWKFLVWTVREMLVKPTNPVAT